MVKFTLLNAEFLNCLAEFTKTLLGTLIQTLQRLPKTKIRPYLPLSNKSWRLLHIHLLLKVLLKKDIFNIKLVENFSWRQSKLQKCVALSTIEAESISATEACKEMLWLKIFLKELGLKQKKYVVKCHR